jgi:hypothetical protein
MQELMQVSHEFASQPDAIESHFLDVAGVLERSCNSLAWLAVGLTPEQEACDWANRIESIDAMLAIARNQSRELRRAANVIQTRRERAAGRSRRRG